MPQRKSVPTRLLAVVRSHPPPTGEGLRADGPRQEWCKTDQSDWDDSRRLDVVAQGFGLALHIRKPLLDHVADRYDADQAILRQHGDVAESPMRHPLHDVADLVGLAAS